MHNEQLGACPICGADLKRDREYLICPAGDYKVLESTFDQIWDTFIKDPSHRDNLQLATKLVDDLVNSNETKT